MTASSWRDRFWLAIGPMLLIMLVLAWCHLAAAYARLHEARAKVRACGCAEVAP